MTHITDFFKESQTRLELILEQKLSQTKPVSKRLNDAIQYSIFNGGKRFRPTLCYATAIALKGSAEQVNGVAAAIELIHCYSLVHDDLPAMDDDDLRRGKPTCHIAFDEATAILVGDALQAYSFQVLAQLNPEISSDRKLAMLSSLALASGSEGMASGQALDLASTNEPCTIEQLERIHQYKTGKIISACVDLSALAIGKSATAEHKALQSYSKILGLAFQVKDDILDVEGSTEALGKTQGADQALNKSTYPSLLGLKAAKAMAESLHLQAIEALAIFGEEAKLLRELSDYVIHREN